MHKPLVMALYRGISANTGATPPEDCGGAPGYEDFVQAMADPTHEEHAEMAQWIGRDSWDPNAFDTSEVNAWLENVKL